MKTATIAKPAVKRCAPTNTTARTHSELFDRIEDRTLARVNSVVSGIMRDETLNAQLRGSAIIAAVSAAMRDERTAMAAAQTLNSMGFL
jgi:hypothetical protein